MIGQDFEAHHIKKCGDKYFGLAVKKLAGRIRFRSAHHLAVKLNNKFVWDRNQNDGEFIGDIH
jgi:hypothetical protein